MSYTCPYCGRTSHHPVDARERYCGACHRFEADETGLRRCARWSLGLMTDADYADALEAEGMPADDPSVLILRRTAHRDPSTHDPKG